MEQWQIFPNVNGDPDMSTVGYLCGSLVREVAAVHDIDDARLIAAAPALLAALERIANSCEEYAIGPDCADPVDLCEAMAQDARAAIAAARGEG